MRELTGEYQREQSKGDDHVVPSRVSVAVYVRAMWEKYGLILDPISTKMSPTDAIYLRRFFRFGADEPCVDVMSRFRNACFPEVSDPWNMLPIHRAISVRAQAIELVTSSHVPIKIVSAFLELFPRNLWDEDHWGTDAQLSRQYKSLIESGIISNGLLLDAEQSAMKLVYNRSWM
jgi:hypothetical protein